jgi:hypothetical protein
VAALRLSHRGESQAIVLGAALAAIAGNGTTQRAPCVERFRTGRFYIKLLGKRTID